MRGGERRDHAVELIALDVEQEHIGRVGRHVHRHLLHEVVLQGPHAENEESAKSDGEQHQVHLPARTRELQRRVAQREPR